MRIKVNITFKLLHMIPFTFLYRFYLVTMFFAFASFIQAQSLPIDFESNISTADFIDFDGGVAMVIANPYTDDNNNSETVAQIIRNGGQIWGGSKIQLDNDLDFTDMNSFSMKVYTTAPVGTQVKLKLEGNGEAERDSYTTLTGEWETMTWDFTGTHSGYTDLVFMFDFGNLGDGSDNSTFYFDDVQQFFGGYQIDLPVFFEGDNINYTTTDFGGNVSSLTTDPEDASNHVVQVLKTNGAATWAGTTIGTPAGFATNIPLTLTDSKMTVRVWSPTANTPIRLKVEDHRDPTHTCETQTNTTLGGEWETIEFDFANQAMGTELLSVGLQMGWTFNMASIFFDFGTEGGVNGEYTYFFDDVQFGDLSSQIKVVTNDIFEVFPNPTSNIWNIHTVENLITSIELYDINGKRIQSFYPSSNSTIIDANKYNPGVYIAKVNTGSSSNLFKLIKE